MSKQNGQFLDGKFLTPLGKFHTPLKRGAGQMATPMKTPKSVRRGPEPVAEESASEEDEADSEEGGDE